MTIYTVSQISVAIKKTLEGSFSTLQISGEISNLRLQSSGHYYFTLKDDQAQISCALFRGDALRIKSQLKDGDQIIATGNLSVFTPKGNYQLIVKEIQHKGLGDLLAQLEALKRKYAEKGYFDQSRKKKLPRFAKTIGVITSSTGAVIQDIIHTLGRRHSGFKLVLIPCKVQGEGSSQEIACALDFMNKHKLCDIIIVGRGGGSLEDLWCFNEEKVVEAIYRSQIPVISAVGHETDFTLADFVADVRAPTPTAAAEMALIDIQEFMEQVRALFKTISQLFHKKIASDKKLLLQIQKRPELCSASMLLQNYYFSMENIQSKLELLFSSHFEQIKSRFQAKKGLLYNLKPDNQVKEKRLRLKNLIHQLSAKGQIILDTLDHKNHLVAHSLKQRWPQYIKDKNSSFNRIQELLKMLHPENVLSKGYAIMESPDGQNLYTSILDLEQNHCLRLKLKDGSCLVNVINKSSANENTYGK